MSPDEFLDRAMGDGDKASSFATQEFTSKTFKTKTFNADKKFDTKTKSFDKKYQTKSWTPEKQQSSLTDKKTDFSDKESHMSAKTWKGYEQAWKGSDKSITYDQKAHESGKYVDRYDAKYRDSKKYYDGPEVNKIYEEMALIDKSLRNTADIQSHKLTLAEIREILNEQK
ncbi:MAG: hypothetical protein AAF984_01655 [Verrucomicrobiota bacterium]